VIQRISMCEGCPSRGSSRKSPEQNLKQAAHPHLCHHNSDEKCAGVIARSPKGFRILMDQLYNEANGRRLG